MATDLKAFQARLNSDPAFRSQFFQDPVGSLEDEGLILPDTAKAGLTSLIAQLMTREPPVTGSTLDEGTINIILNIEI